MTALLIALISVVVLYGAFLVIASAISVWPPRIPVYLSASQLGLPQEHIEFVTSDGLTLRGWWVEGGAETVVVCLHGYLTNRSELVPYAGRLREMGASILAIDLRCHGWSDRSKCTFGSIEKLDAMAAIAYARSRAPGCKIVIFGSSMGAVAGLRAACEDLDSVQALVLDGAYGRLDEAAKGFWEIGGLGPVSKLLAPTAHFGSLWIGTKTKNVTTFHLFEQAKEIPLLLLYGTRDTVAPMASAEKCVAVSGHNSTVVWFEGCGHGQARYARAQEYFEAVHDFLVDNKLLQRLPDIEKSRTIQIVPTESAV